tara:strand:- start:112 stop:1491 length:1380 start_codon:yes stop_codon:yes gene_type:complete
MDIANISELDDFLHKHPSVTMMEVLMVDINGIIRCKRIPRREFEELYNHGIKGPASTVLLNVKGEFCDELNKADLEGDPDRLIRPIKNTLSYISWLDSETAQVMATFTELNGEPNQSDPRNVLINALEALRSMELKMVVATELEFYLIKSGSSSTPEPFLSKIPGTSIDQAGIQYAMPEDLWDQDNFLNDVREACDCQNVPMTTIHSEYSPGQFEINLHHTSDPVKACQDAFLLKRIVKGIARKHNMSATFMAKPFMQIAGSGLHIHISLYDKNGKNIFYDVNSSATPSVSKQLLNAIGGLSSVMAESMVIFAPNANSYRRLIPGNFAPLTPNWGYNHRDVALRVPVSDNSNMRIEHRVAGADANPYLVLSAIIAGIHHGLTQQVNPSEMILEGAEIEEKITLPRFWPDALNEFGTSAILPQYLGADFCKLFETVRRGEMEEINSQITNIDYEWYLRAM